MINRRFMIVPPALPSGEHAEQLEETSEGFSRLLLEMANIRVLRYTDSIRSLRGYYWFAARSGLLRCHAPRHDGNAAHPAPR